MSKKKKKKGACPSDKARHFSIGEKEGATERLESGGAQQGDEYVSEHSQVKSQKKHSP